MMKSNQQNRKIKFISECYIKPKYEIELTKTPYYLGPIDLLFLSLGTIQKGLLFHNKPQNIIESNFLEKLKESLSISLVHFYPLAGQLATHKFSNEHTIWVYVDCNKGPGARIIHASVDYTVDDILSSKDVHPIVSSLFDLSDEKVVNYDGHLRPLLSIQVTEFIDGLFIGFMMNHSLADGTSQWHFVRTLSHIFQQFKDCDIISSKNLETDPFKGVTISQKPIFGPFFPQGYGPILKLPYLEPEEFITRFDPGPLRERIFHFSSKAISKLKTKANEECNSNNINQISSFQALTGFIWRSITRIRNPKPHEETTCTLIVNYRPRLKPPFSEDNFGNFLSAAQETCKVGELLSNGLGWAALLVHKSVVAQDEKTIQGFLSDYCKAPYVEKPGLASELYKQKPNSVSIGGSARFDAYGPEFGLGKAVAVLAGYANKDDGKITASPGREGKGSVDLEISLVAETMNALELDEEFMNFVA